MSSEKFAAGRKAALQDIKNIIKGSRESIDKMDMSHFTGNKKAFSTPEVTAFFTDSHKNFFELVQKDFERLEKGESTQDIRDIPPFSMKEDTEGAGKISAYRDVYNMVQSITSEEALLPVPENISRWHRKKAANIQAGIVGTARTLVMQSIATKGQSETLKYEKECAEARAREQLATIGQSRASGHSGLEGHTTSRQGFNQEAAPQPAPARRDYAVIDMDYVQSFEEKNLQHPADMDGDSLSYFRGLHEAITVIENYKSSIKNKQFVRSAPPRTPPSIEQFRNRNKAGNNSSSSPQTGFCRAQSQEIISVAREAIIAMMKGAEPDKICNKVSADSKEKGFAKALDDISCIINEINPDKISITHSHGYRLTTSPQQITHMARSVTEQTTNEMSALMKVLAKAGSAEKLLQTGIVETLTRGQRAQSTQQRSYNNTLDPS